MGKPKTREPRNKEKEMTDEECYLCGNLISDCDCCIRCEQIPCECEYDDWECEECEEIGHVCIECEIALGWD